MNTYNFNDTLILTTLNIIAAFLHKQLVDID